MTKTFTTAVSKHLASLAWSADYDATAKTGDRSFVWKLEFRSLRFVCDLYFGACIFPGSGHIRIAS
jgi:hypothetical protein